MHWVAVLVGRVKASLAASTGFAGAEDVMTAHAATLEIAP